jgi:hypothetical protein
MILGDRGAGRCRCAISPRSVDPVDGTIGALKEGLCWTRAIGTGTPLGEQGGLPFYSRVNSIG